MLILVACGKTDPNETVTSFGNSQKNNNYIGQGNVFANVPIVEEVTGSDLNNFVGIPISIPGNYTISSTGQNTVALLRGRKVKWEFSLPEGHYPVTSYLYFKQKIYFAGSDTNLYSLDINGDIVNKSKLKNARSILFTDPIASDNKVFIASTDGEIYKFNENLELEKNTNIDGRIERQLILSKNKLILNNSFNESGDRTLIFDLDLNLKNEYKINQQAEIYSFPVANDSLVIIFQREEIREEIYYKTISLDHQANELWVKETTLAPKHVSFDSDGNAYIVFSSTGMGQNITNILKYDLSGKQTASFNIDFFLPSPVLLADDFVAFIGTNRDAAALFYLEPESLKLYDNLDLTNMNLINSYPAVSKSNTLRFTSTTAPRMVQINSSLLDLY